MPGISVFLAEWPNARRGRSATSTDDRLRPRAQMDESIIRTVWPSVAAYPGPAGLGSGLLSHDYPGPDRLARAGADLLQEVARGRARHVRLGDPLPADESPADGVQGIQRDADQGSAARPDQGREAGHGRQQRILPGRDARCYRRQRPDRSFVAGRAGTRIGPACDPASGRGVGTACEGQPRADSRSSAVSGSTVADLFRPFSPIP